ILDEDRPEHVAVVFDTPQPTFRHKLFAAYKATRQKMPEDMASQLDKLKEVVRGFSTPTIELAGYEADDIMGTLARRAEREGVMTVLVTGDKDFMQLVSPFVSLYHPGKTGTEGEIIDAAGVLKKFGVQPAQVTDVLGLIGDKSDNVPGVPGIGEKTAIPLIQAYGDMETLYARLEEVPQKGVREKLREHRDLAFLSKKLVTIDTGAPVPIDFHQLRAAPRDLAKLRELFADLEFKTLLPRLQPGSDAGPGGPAASFGASLAAERTAQGVLDITTDRHEYQVVRSVKEVKALCARLRACDRIAVDTETTSTDPMRAHLIGLSFSTCEREGFYIPVRTRAFVDTPPSDLFQTSTTAGEVPLGHLAEALEAEQVLPLLKPVLENAAIRKVGQNIKYDLLVLQRHGIQLAGIGFDTMVGSYILRADGLHNLDALAMGAFNYRMISYEDLVGKGRSQKLITEVTLEQIADYSAEDADFTMRLYGYQVKELERLGLLQLCEEIEFPLIPVLARMEAAGVSLDTPYLEGMSKELERQLQNLASDIHRAAGGTFNINSTQQLGDVLFNRLKLPSQKRTKTGFSTDVSVLEALRGQHPIIDLLLDYRQLAKLKSTYIDALPSLINPETGRVHTSFNQTVAATGRLSSSDPNLQNIPIRTEIGRSIRRAFIPADGMRLMSADYSQIELRIMAHISGDEGLVQAFRNKEDIHATTASKVFGVAQQAVTRDMRRKAKEVN
ncbi:MAG TPA: DNA polymerase I, partial [Bacteroidota bacterium]